MKSKVRKRATMLLVLCMAVLMFAGNVFAADSDSSSKIDSCEKVIKEYSAEQAARYIAGDNTYPKLDGYLFAGWYNKDTCNKEDLIAGESPSGEQAYALFVPEHVLSIQAQVSANLIDEDLTNDETGSLRFITSVDSLLYKQVGFEVCYVSADGVTRKATSASNKVYSKLYEMDSTNVWEKTPQDTFCGLSNYFKICTVKNIPTSEYYDTEFTVRPFWITMDDDKVYGVTATKALAEGCLREDVYVSSTSGVDAPHHGSYENPYATLNYAIAHVLDGGTVHVKDDFIVTTTEYEWQEHYKNVVITGDDSDTDSETLDFSALTELYINDGVKFTALDLKFPAASTENNRVFAQGHDLIIANDTTVTTGVLQLFGGSVNSAVERTYMELYAGTYSSIYGGSATKDVLGDTKVIVGEGVNSGIDYEEHSSSHILFGAGWKGAVYGDTNVEVKSGAQFNYVFGGGHEAEATVKGTTNVKFAGNAMCVCGGSRSGSNSDTNVVMTGGWAHQIFGGSESTSMTGDTNVQILGGEVERRIFGGCYNDSNGTNQVTGNTNVLIGPKANISFSYSSWYDNVLRAISRYGSFEGEYGTFIFNEESSYINNMGDSGFGSPAYHYRVKTNGNTTGVVENDLYGSVLPAGDCLHIIPKEGYVATVTIGDVVKHYTEGESYYPLPELSSKTSQTDIIVTFNTTEATDFIASAEAKIATGEGYAYFETLEQAIAAAEKMENATIENLSSTKKLASIVIEDVKNGTVTTDKKNCLAGETVTLSGVGNEGYYCVGMKVNGEEVAINTDGTYSFTTEEKTYTVEGIFAEKVFIDNANWNLFTQNKGVVSLPTGGNGGMLQFAKQYTDMDLTITAKDYVKDEVVEKVVDGVTTEEVAYERTDVLFVFENGAGISFGIVQYDGGAAVQTMNHSSHSKIYDNWTTWGEWTTEEFTQYQNDGVNLRLIRVGTEIYVYLGDRYLATADLTNNSSGVTADTKATVYLRHYDDSGVQVDIPFEVTTDLNMVPVHVADGIENGSINCRNYYLEGETVTLQVAGDSNYFYDSLKINGEEVVADYKDGTYTFAATEASYTVDASFAYKIFNNDSNSYLVNQNVGMVVQKSDATANAALNFAKSYTNFDITMKVKGYDLDADADGDGNNLSRTNIRMWIENQQVNMGIARNTIEGGCKYTVQTMGGDTILPANTDLYTLTEAEIAKYNSDEGIEFRVVRNGTVINYYVDGHWVYTADLTKTNAGADTGITTTTTGTMRLNRYDDVGHEVEIPITVSETVPEEVQITTTTDGNGTITFDRESYIIGEKVTFTVAGNSNYFYDSLKVNGEEVVAAYKDGTYTFTATEASYTVDASFAYKIFNNDSNSYLVNQNVGMVVQKSDAAANAALNFAKSYTNFDITMKVKGYDLDEDADGDNNNLSRTNIRMWINNQQVNMGIARNTIEGGCKYTVQTMGGDTILPANTDLYTLTDAEIAKYNSDEGVEFRVVRQGTVIYYLVDGHWVYTADLTKTNAGADTGITATTAGTMRLNRYDDVGHEVEIPIKVSDSVPEIEILSMTDGNGTITFDKDEYSVGEKVTFTVAGNTNYFYNSLKVNGQEVVANYQDGTYSFIAKEGINTVEASFAYKIFNNDTNSYLINQNVGMVVQKSDATANAALNFAKSYTNFDITMKVKGYDLDADADGDGNNLSRTNIRMWINNQQVNMGIARNTIEGGCKYTVQTMGGDTILPANTDLYTLTDAEIAKYNSDEGIEFRVVRSGTVIYYYVDGHWVYTADLTKTNAGADTGITATTAGTMRLNRYDDVGHEVKIPITVSETVPAQVNVTSTTDGNGTITFDRESYIVGEKVTFTVAGNDGYFYNSLKVNGEEVIADYKDGSYTFTATETSYTVEASFAPAIFGEDANCYLVNQNVGMVVQKKEATANAWVGFAKAYTNFDIAMKVKGYDLDSDADKDGNNLSRTNIRMYIGSHKVNMGIARNTIEGGCKYTVQSMGNDTILPANTDLYTLTDAEIAKYNSDEGVEFRAIRNGTEINFYVDSHWVYTVDLTKTNTGADTGFIATTTATLVLARYDDIGHEVKIPITVSETVPEEANITSTTDGNGTINFDRESYIVGEKVTFTVAGNEGYFYNSLKVDGEEVIADINGTYTFTVSNTNHTVEASFAPAIFNTNAEFNVLSQNVGVLRVPASGDGDTDYIVTKGSYNEVTATVKVLGDETSTFAFYEEFVFDGVKPIRFRVTNDTGGAGWRVESGGQFFGWNYKSELLTDAQKEKLFGNGIEFKIVRDGLVVKVYLDGMDMFPEETFDLTINSSGITETTTATAGFRLYGNAGYETEIKFQLGSTSTTFVSSNQEWDLSRQLAGVVSLPANHSGSSGFLYFNDKYKDINLALNVKDYIGDSTNSTLRQLVWFAFNNGTTASFSVTYTGPADNPNEWAYKVQSMNDAIFG